MFLVAAALLAYVLARRDRRHRPVAIALGLIAGASLVRLGLSWTVLAAPGPYMGWTRAGFHVEQALYLVSTIALPWLAGHVLMFPEGRIDRWGRSPHWIVNPPIVAAWASYVVMCATSYPELRGDALRRVYLCAELTALFVCAVAIVSWWRRRPVVRETEKGVFISTDHPGGPFSDPLPTLIELAGQRAGPAWYTIASVLCLVAGDAALLLVGAWPRGLFGEAYMLQQAGLLGLYAIVAGVHVVALALTRRRAA